MKYFSTFSGIGGFELGIERITKATCIGYSEIDKYAKQIYKKHFNHKNYGDITEINAKDLPEFELLVGGFPCQSFSIAGKRGGFSDTRGTLFFDLARLAQQKQPRLLLFENVKGLLSHDKGRTFRTIIRTLDELGYDLQWQVLNSKYHGVPQNRERVFIVGHLRGTPRPKVFPIGGDDRVSEREDISGRGQSQTEHSTTVREGMGSKADSTFIKTVGLIKEKERPEGNYLPRERVISSEGKSRAVSTSQSQHPWYKDGVEIRKLTPLECERLQGFPDRWTEKGIDKDGNEVEISDTQRYKTLGNAVTVNVIEDIVKNMI